MASKLPPGTVMTESLQAAQDRPMSDDDVKREYHAGKVEELLRIADEWAKGCPGMTKEESDNMAAQFRAEARAAAKNPDYFSTLKPALGYMAHPALIEVKENVTAETEAFHEKQTHAGKSTKRPWHAIADPILISLRKDHPAIQARDLRHELELGWPKDSKIKLPKPRAIEKHIDDLEKDGKLLPLA